jgi:arylsulfatase A-like enzyme
MKRIGACLIPWVLAAAWLSPVPSSAEDEGTAARPNILFILTDDQRADAIAAHGNPYIRTPTLDRLAHRGFSFREAHIMGAHHGAVCAPSRAMLLSGRTLFHVYDSLDEVPTFPELLRRSGYATFVTGKWHQSESSLARSFAVGRRVFLGGMSRHDAVPLRDLAPDGSLGEARRGGFSTDLFADATIDFLREHAARKDGRPFLAYVAFTAPHDPRTPQEPYRSWYHGDEMPLPPDFLPVHPFDDGWMTGRDEQLAAWPRTPEVIREQRAEYYGLVSHLDARVGDILDALDETGLGRTTIVVFTSDNGLALGSLGLLGKQSLYEHSTRVPLILAGPGLPTGESRALVTLYDLFPTLLRLCGVALPSSIEGLDLAPLWRGESRQVREVLYTAFEASQRAVRDGRFKLVLYPKIGHEQLFDLERDPLELRNLAADPAHGETKARLRARMEEQHAALGDPHPLAVEILSPKEFDYRSVERKPDAHQPAWVIEKYFRDVEAPAMPARPPS